jgi:hypothetical protein
MSSTEIEVSWQKGEYKTGPTNYSISAIDDKNNATKFSCSTKGKPVYCITNNNNSLFLLALYSIKQ